MTRRQAVAWAFVGGQTMLIASLLVLPRGRSWRTPRWLRLSANAVSLAGLGGMAVAATGLGASLTPSPIPKAGAELVTSGLYSHVRHPLYAFLLLSAFGRVLAGGSLHRCGAFAGLALLLTAKAGWEEDRLTERFSDYPRYAATTPRFAPRLSKRWISRELA